MPAPRASKAVFFFFCCLFFHPPAFPTALHKKGAKESLANVVQSWLGRYEENGLGAVAQLCTLLGRAAGASVTLDPHQDIESPDAEALQAKLIDPSVTKYPFAADKTFGENVLSFFGKLVAQAGDVLMDEFLIAHLTVWIEMLSNWEARPFRHVGTAVGLQLISSLIKVQKKSKGDKAKQVAELINTLFEIVFVLRYRDVWMDLRALCIKALSSWVLDYDDVMLDTRYIKYIGWALFDPKPSVRLEAVRGLLGLYDSEDRLEQLEKFTTRFKGRIGSLPDDKDIAVACAGVRLCAVLAKADKLEEERVQHIYELVADKNQTVRAAAGEFALAIYFGQEEGPLQLLEFAKDKSADCVVRALWAAGTPAAWLRDWEAFTRLLLREEEGLTNEQQALLAGLLSASVAQVVAANNKADVLKCNTDIVNCLHKLLKRFKADAAAVRPLVAMVRHVNPELFASLHKGSNHRKAVELLGEILCDHNDSALARDALAALMHLSDPTYPLAAEAHATVQRVSERIVAGFNEPAADSSVAEDEDAAFALQHMLMLLSVLSRQTDLGLSSATFGMLKRLVEDHIGGATWMGAATVKDALETEATDIMWSLAKLLKKTGGNADDVEARRDDLFYQLEKVLGTAESAELIVAAVCTTTNMLSLFGSYLKKYHLPRLSLSCSQSLCSALVGAFHRLLDRDKEDRDASAIAAVVDSLCKTIKIHSLPISVAADVIVHINDDDATAAKAKDLLSTLRKDLDLAGKGENEYLVILATLKLAHQRFTKSNEYDDDRKVMRDLAQSLVRSYGVVPSLAHKKSMVLLMQEATPYALGLGDAGFVFLKDLLLPFTSRMPEPKVMLDFFEKQALPADAADSPYYNDLEEFREHLKKLADPTAFKTPLKKKKAAATKKVNPRMKLQLEGEEDDEEGEEKEASEARGASTGKKGLKGKEEEQDEEEPKPKKKRASPKKKANKAARDEDEDEEENKEADEARGASPAKGKQAATAAAPAERRRSSRGGAKKDYAEEQEIVVEQEEQPTPEPQKRGRGAKKASPAKSKQEPEEEEKEASPKKKRASKTPSKNKSPAPAVSEEPEEVDEDDEARGAAVSRGRGKKGGSGKRASPATSSSTKETKKKARTKRK